MQITSMLFLFIFLPLALALYYIANDNVKEYFLLAISLLFYSLGSLHYIIVFIFAVFFTVVLGREIFFTKKEMIKRCLLAIGIIVNVSLLIYYKYIGLIIGRYVDLAIFQNQIKEITLPLGISFFTFKAISYLVDTYRGDIILSENPVHDALYLSFFAQIQSGPLTRYNNMERDVESNKNLFVSEMFAKGVMRFLIGFNKKILLANVLSIITTEVFSTPYENFSVCFAWFGSICYSLQLFFDFSGYSDMAIGISKMFGYNCMENFNYPYMTKSISHFWRRWHISLSEWFRDYIYIPLGGSRYESKLRVYFNLFVVWLLTGLWHGASFHFIVWGLGYFWAISFERIMGLPGKIKTKIGRGLYRVLSLLFINFQWVIFNSKNLSAGLCYIQRMFFCENNKLADIRTAFLFKDNLFFIITALILCTPIVPWIGSKIEKETMICTMYEIIISIIIIFGFIWSISFVVAGQNNPFAYANF